MKKFYSFLLFISLTGFSQIISVNTTTYTVPQLIQDVLIDSPCALVSNFSSSATCGICYFEYTGSNFDFSAGVILRNGNAANSAGIYTGTNLSSICSNSSDAQLQAISNANGGTDSINDATFIEFDFTPLTDRFSFNYIFASNEYGDYQCDYSDVFAFILTDLTTGISTNLAVIPSTTTPVSVTSIRDGAYFTGIGANCGSLNSQYFDVFNPVAPASAVMNMKGYTVPLTAFADVIPNRNYRIKLAIGDYIDTSFDSAVFIEAGSFNVGVADLTYPVGIGTQTADMTEANGLAMCPGTTRVLDSGLSAADYNFVWTLNSVVIPGEVGSALTVSSPGTYCLQASNISGASCTQSDCILVEYLPGITVNQTPPDLYSCTNNFTLSDNNSSILGALDPFAYDVLFYLSAQDAIDNINQIAANFPATLSSTPIFVRVENLVIPCPAFSQFNAIVNSATPTVSISGTTTIPSGTNTTITFSGTPNALVTYNIDGGSDLTLTLDSFGFATLTTPNLMANSTYNLVFVFSGCLVNVSGSAIITVTTGPTASVSANTICFGSAGTVTFTGTPGAEVTYTVDGSPNQTVNLDASGEFILTTLTLTANSVYTLVQVFDGTNTTTLTGVSATVTVIALPTAIISGAASICSGSSTNLTISGTTDAIVNYTDGFSNFTTTLVGGTSTIAVSPTADTTYSVVSVQSNTTPVCTATPASSVTITVSQQVTGSLSYTPSDFCTIDLATYAPNVLISGAGTGSCAATTPNYTASPAGLTIDASTGVITPSTSLVNTYTITLNYPACGGCGSVDLITTVSISSPGTATVNYATPLCSNDTATYAPTLLGAPSATNYISAPTGLSIDNTTGVITPGTSLPGIYTINYTPASVGACVIVGIPATVTITAAPTASISYAASPYCNDIIAQQGVTLMGTNAYTGGTFSANPVTGLILDPSTGAITPSGSTSGTYTVSYAIPSGAGCTPIPVTTTVTITGIPTANISYAATPYCNDITTPQGVTLTGTNSYTGGTFSANPATGLILDASTGAITPSGSTPGTYTVTYAIPSGGGCTPSPVSTTVTITAAPTASISYAASPYCNDIIAQQGVTLMGTNAYTGGTFSANPVTGLILDPSTGAITPSGSTSGTYTVSYAIPSGAGCTPIPVTTTVTITGIPTANISYAATPYCNDITTPQGVTLTGTNSYTGGTFSANPATGLILDASTGAITPSGSTPGTYTVTYAIPSGGGCTPSPVSATVTITSGILPIFTQASAVCAGFPVNLLTTSTNGISGTWQQLSATATSATYTFTPTAGQCALPIQMIVPINPLPVVTPIVTPNTNSLCSGETIDILLTSNVPGSTFSWTSTSPTVSGHSSSVLGSTATTISQILTLNTGVTATGQVTYAIIAEANGCAGPTTFVTIDVNPKPEVSVNGANPSALCSGNTTAISFSSNVSNTIYSWTVQSVTGVSGAFNGSGASIAQQLQTTGLSSGVVVYEVIPSLNGCLGTPVLVTVNVNPIPQVFGSTTQSAVCSGLQPTSIALSSPDPNTVYTWIVNQVGVSGATAGTSTGSNLLINQLLTTTDANTAGYVDYIITPSLNGCPGASLTIRVNVNPIPQVSIADGVICVDAVTGYTFQTYELTTGLDESIYDFVWYIDNVAQPNSNVSSFTASVVGIYGVEVTSTLANCASIVAEATVTATIPATALTTTVSNAFTDNATIVVTVADGTGTLLYQLDEGALQESNVFTGVSAGPHQITVLDSDGCTFLQETVLLIDYPKYFTPNGDGINDTWNISGLNQAQAKLFIFDRYGKLIKQLIPMDGEMGWDGTYNQQQLPSTDYWFTLDYTENGIAKQFKAHFSMKR